MLGVLGFFPRHLILVSCFAHFHIHPRATRISTVVFHALPPVIPGNAGPSSLTQADHIPWFGQTILITKIKHPFKGCQAVVKNVLCNQDTISGLRIVAQLSHWDPTVPFQTIVLDYDDVVEAVYV